MERAGKRYRLPRAVEYIDQPMMEVGGVQEARAVHLADRDALEDAALGALLHLKRRAGTARPGGNAAVLSGEDEFRGGVRIGRIYKKCAGIAVEHLPSRRRRAAGRIIRRDLHS